VVADEDGWFVENEAVKIDSFGGRQREEAAKRVAKHRHVTLDDPKECVKILDFASEAVLVAVATVATSPPVWDDQRELLGEMWDDGVPGTTRARRAVHEHEWRSVTVSVVRNTCPISGGHCLHCAFYRPCSNGECVSLNHSAV
jgi:hypothetical protein